jgi:hypothetical protein
MRVIVHVYDMTLWVKSWVDDPNSLGDNLRHRTWP